MRFKHFKLDKNSDANLTQFNNKKKLRIDIDAPWEPITAEKARKFAKWLNEAADEIDREYNSQMIDKLREGL